MNDRTEVTPNDQPDEYFRNNAAAAYSWLEQHMPDECTEALERFVATNPNQRGIDWWTALDMLRDADAHLDILEPLVEMTNGWGVLHTYVTLTLIYTDRSFTQVLNDDQRFATMRAFIVNR